MARIHRRNHSVSGPPSVHCVMKDVACCCNIVKIQQFYMSLMALRRNPQRKCKKEEVTACSGETSGIIVNEINEDTLQPKIATKNHPHKFAPRQVLVNTSQPFRFLDLPREVRDHVYSYLVIRRGSKVPIIEARAIIRGQRKRVTAKRTRERLNQKRAQTGKRPIIPRESTAEPIIHSNVLQASQQLHDEATDFLYQNNWFAMSLENFCFTTIDAPVGWKCDRITRLQLELQLKDSQRMNYYIDWAAFFSSFPAIRFLHIIPSFHPRYHDWARTELQDWENAHFVFRGFFRELMASIPEWIHLKLGPSFDPTEDMHLEGQGPVSTRLLEQMHDEFC
ncbi:hypothetical protein CC78DRAFT_32020 [Lojkania enalia]|uniref:Uncharacterized protein n=1 Tax=Lojkania enalia TaxID=147567 RepID=A0A9P4KH43_9PLEO|nr:hypothetical protein CC78DRAFT_32020 [Didymosphaeria enalia]